jgi:hypothetical protein
MAHNAPVIRHRADCAEGEVTVMNPAILLMITYIFVVMVVQALGFGVSKLVDYINPSWSLLVFLVLFIGAFGLAWPIAVRLTEPKSLKGPLENDLKTLAERARTHCLRIGRQAIFARHRGRSG